MKVLCTDLLKPMARCPWSPELTTQLTLMCLVDHGLLIILPIVQEAPDAPEPEVETQGSAIAAQLS